MCYMVLVAEVVAVASAPPVSPRGRVAAAGYFRVFVQDETIFVALSRTGCFFGQSKTQGVNIRGPSYPTLFPASGTSVYSTTAG